MKESDQNDSLGYKIEGEFISLNIELIDEIAGKRKKELRGSISYNMYANVSQACCNYAGNPRSNY
jgi:hypothetical protein